MSRKDPGSLDHHRSCARLANALLPDGRRADIFVAEGRIAAIAPEPERDGTDREAVDLDGRLILPGLIDGHIHLDKAMIRGPWRSHRPYTNGFDVRERVRFEKEILATAAPVAERAADLVETVIAHGTTHLRTHVDIDAVSGLANLEAVLQVRERFRDRVCIEIVAFPQSGILASPGTADLLEAAMRMGADLVGGLDPASLDRDVAAHLDIVFGLAERHAAGIDIHLHDGGGTGLDEIAEIAARTRAAGLGGRVAISHAFALGDADPATLARTAETLAASGVAIMTHAPGHRAFPPVLALREAGVTVFSGNDNIRDAWRPFGSGDMLQRAMIVAYRSGFATDEELEAALDLATGAAAEALGLGLHGLVVGAPADLVALRASHVPEAVVSHPGDRLVFKCGRLVAAQGRLAAG